MAQQRTSTPRRSLNPATRPSYNDIAWLPISKLGTDVTCQLSQDSASLVRTGVPQIKALSLGVFPDSVVWSGATMILTYPAALSDPETFVCGIQTPQIRSYSGGYLAAATLGLGNPTPAPLGTIFAPYCSGTELRGAIADGVGGTADGLVSADSPGCGFLPAPPTAGWILSTFCTGHDLWGNVADGLGGTTPQLLSLQSDGCGSGITNMEIAWYPIPDGSGGVDIHCDTNSGSIVSSTGPGFTAGAQLLSGYTISGFVINLTFPLPVNTGDIICYNGSGHAITNDWNQGLAVMCQALP